MRHTKIGVFKISRNQVDWPAVLEWLDFLGVKNPQAVQEQLASGTDATQLIALCGKRCYASFDTESGLNPNVTKIRTDHAEYITNILRSGHGSVLEHATWSFAIENVSRVFTGEMNRHRAGVAISEASMRYIRFDDIGFTVPGSLLNSDAPEARLTEEILDTAFQQTEKLYLDLCNVWKIDEMKDFTQKKKLTSMFRRIVGMGVSTGGVWTINARALNHIAHMRASEHAEEEICDVFDKIITIVVRDEPLLFGHFRKNEKGFWESGYPKV